MTNRVSKQTGPTNLDELARKTGLVIRSVDSDAIDVFSTSSNDTIHENEPRLLSI